MNLKLSNDVSDINYHFVNNFISESSISRNLNKLQLNNTFVISQKYEGRPDMVSKLIYATDTYDWVLLFINGLTLDEFKTGVSIKFPSISELNKFLIE